MCEHLTPLARIDCQRYIIACEHEITHVMWDNVSLRISSRRFVPIVEQLSKALENTVQRRIAGNRAVSVVLDQNDRFQVWIEGCALYLTPNNVKRFVAMMQTAARHAHAVEMAERSDDSENLPPVDEPLRVPPHLFSVN